MSQKFTIEGIKSLIERFQQHAISAQEFCVSFERIWNFDFKKNSVSIEIYEALDFLFDEVVLFSPFPREQWEYPKYRDEMEIRSAAAKVLLLLENKK